MINAHPPSDNTNPTYTCDIVWPHQQIQNSSSNSVGEFFFRSGVTNTPHGGVVNCAQVEIPGMPFRSQRTQGRVLKTYILTVGLQKGWGTTRESWWEVSRFRSALSPADPHYFRPKGLGGGRGSQAPPPQAQPAIPLSRPHRTDPLTRADQLDQFCLSVAGPASPIPILRVPAGA